MTLVCNGKTYKWCTKDSHNCPCWYIRATCYDRVDYKNKMEENESDKPKGDSKSGVSDDFKVALQALVSESDFQTLSEQFMSKNF